MPYQSSALDLSIDVEPQYKHAHIPCNRVQRDVGSGGDEAQSVFEK